ncbi:MAG: hypothetical protein EBY43_08980, partial [Opitutae bacterium]|nr:hypothetical protein [Opitutae bacterium]
MAGANLPAKKYKKTSPTITRLSFEFDGGSTAYIDIAKALSAINRKFYRQGVYYYVNSVEIYNNETGVVDLHTIPDNWITKNAWNRGFRLYQKMNAMVDEVSDVGRPKYHDFKVFMSPRHVDEGSASPSLYDINAEQTMWVSDAWDYSQFVSADDNQNPNPDADEFFVHMIGDHLDANGGNDPALGNWKSIGLIKSYGNSRQQPPIQGTPSLDVEASTDPLVNIFDFSSEEQMNDIIVNLDTYNAETPYNHDLYVGESRL